jgi:hypothetical protein
MTGRLGASADGSSTLPDSINLIKKALATQVPFFISILKAVPPARRAVQLLGFGLRRGAYSAEH